MSTNLERFKALFAGRADAYGKYPRPEPQLAGQKRLAKGRCTMAPGNEGYEPLTDEVWQAHLDGTMGLGIVPVRENSQVGFFVIDVDKYTLPDLHVKLVKQIDHLGLPLVVTRSKSGGAHVWCFLARPILAMEAVNTAREWKTKLGLDEFGSKAEIFPKQKAVVDMDAGSWINLPYFGGDNLYDHRFAYGPRGQQLTFEEFLGYAEARKSVASPDDFSKISEDLGTDVVAAALGVTPATVEHQQAPPCIKHMLANGIPEGGRNSALYQFGIYLQRAAGDDWQERLDQINREHFDPPLGSDEVQDTVRSLKRGYGSWRYKCDEHAHICDKATCATVAFGVGGKPKFDKDVVRNVTKVMMPEGESYYIFEVDDQQFSISVSGLNTPNAFKTAYRDVTDKTFRLPKGLKWDDAVDQLLSMITKRVSAPDALSNPALVKDTFRDWVSAGYHGPNNLKDVNDGMPCYLPQTKEIVFKAGAFKARLERNGIRLEVRQLWPIMEKHLQVTERQMRIGHGRVQVMVVPCEEPWFEFQEATEGEFGDPS